MTNDEERVDFDILFKEGQELLSLEQQDKNKMTEEQTVKLDIIRSTIFFEVILPFFTVLLKQKLSVIYEKVSSYNPTLSSIILRDPDGIDHHVRNVQSPQL